MRHSEAHKNAKRGAKTKAAGWRFLYMLTHLFRVKIFGHGEALRMKTSCHSRA